MWLLEKLSLLVWLLYMRRCLRIILSYLWIVILLPLVLTVLLIHFHLVILLLLPKHHSFSLLRLSSFWTFILTALHWLFWKNSLTILLIGKRIIVIVKLLRKLLVVVIVLSWTNLLESIDIKELVTSYIWLTLFRIRCLPLLLLFLLVIILLLLLK